VESYYCLLISFKNLKSIIVDEVTHKIIFYWSIPGFSDYFTWIERSAATIIVDAAKLSRKAAAEFSFFLAVPTLAGAFAKSLGIVKELPNLLNQK